LRDTERGFVLFGLADLGGSGPTRRCRSIQIGSRQEWDFKQP